MNRTCCLVLCLLAGCASFSEADRVLVDQNVQGLNLLSEVLPDALADGQELLAVVETVKKNTEALQEVVGPPATPAPFSEELSAQARKASAEERWKRQRLEAMASNWSTAALGWLAGLGGVGAAVAAAVRARNKWMPALLSVVHALNSVKHAVEEDRPVSVPQMVDRATRHYGGKEVVEEIYQRHVKGKDDLGRRRGGAA